MLKGDTVKLRYNKLREELLVWKFNYGMWQGFVP